VYAISNVTCKVRISILVSVEDGARGVVEGCCC